MGPPVCQYCGREIIAAPPGGDLLFRTVVLSFFSHRVRSVVFILTEERPFFISSLGKPKEKF
jgi:hypothetical protein